MRPSLLLLLAALAPSLPWPSAAQESPDPVQAAAEVLSRDQRRAESAAARLTDFILGPGGFLQQGVAPEDLRPGVQGPVRAWIGSHSMGAAVILSVLDQSPGGKGRLEAALARWKGQLGRSRTAEWLAAFLNDAAQEGANLVLAQRTSPAAVREDLARRGKETAPVTPGAASRDPASLVNAQPKTLSAAAPAPPPPSTTSEEPEWKKALRELYRKWWGE